LLAMPRRSATRLQWQVHTVAPSPDPVRAVWDLLVEYSTDQRPPGEIIPLWTRATADAPQTLARMRGEPAALVQPALTNYFATSLGVDPDRDVRPSVLAASVHAAERAVINKWAELDGEPELGGLFRCAFPVVLGLGAAPAAPLPRRPRRR